MKERRKYVLGVAGLTVLLLILVISGIYFAVGKINSAMEERDSLTNTQTLEEPKEIDRIKHYVDSYDNVIRRILKHSETLEGDNLLREIELSKLQKAELDVELLSDKTMLNSVAYYDIESFRLKTDEFLRVLELLAKKEKIPMRDSNIASEWWEDLTDLLTRYYTREEKAERLDRKSVV